MNLLITFSVVFCVLKGMQADVSELTSNKDRIYLPPRENLQHSSLPDISEKKISLPKALSASLTVLRSNPQILFQNKDTDSSKQIVLTPISDESYAAASSQAEVKTHLLKPTPKPSPKPTPTSKNVTHKSSKIRAKPAKNAKQHKQAKESLQSQLSNIHELFHNKDNEFVPSANAPEVIYHAGDNIQFNDAPFHDILDNADPTYAAKSIETDKRADGYHYAKPKNSFVH